MTDPLEQQLGPYPLPWALEESSDRDATYEVRAANGEVVLCDEHYYPTAPYSYREPGRETAGIDTARLIVDAVNRTCVDEVEPIGCTCGCPPGGRHDEDCSEHGFQPSDDYEGDRPLNANGRARREGRFVPCHKPGPDAPDMICMEPDGHQGSHVYRNPEGTLKPSRGVHPVTPEAIDRQLTEHHADYERLGTEGRFPTCPKCGSTDMQYVSYGRYYCGEGCGEVWPTPPARQDGLAATPG